MVYYSGHGEFDNVLDEGYWIPVNAHQGANNEYIGNDMIRRFISRINSHHTFLVSDSCFAGSLFAGGASKNVSKRYERDPSRWGLTAGRKEIVSDGKPGMHSPFADALLYRLKTSSEPIGVQELCSYVVEQVEANANQSPIGEPLKVDGHKNGQFVFHLKMDEGRDWGETTAVDTAAGYRRYLAMYPAGTHLEEALFKVAEKEDNILSFIEYLDAYPRGAYQRQAEKRVAELEDERDWADTLRLNTILSYRKHKEPHPKGSYIQEAEARVQALLGGTPMPAPKPVATKPAAPLGAAPQSRPTTSSPVSSTPSASVNWKKLLLMGGLPLIVIAMIVWGVSRGGKTKNTSKPPVVGELSTLTLQVVNSWETLWREADLSEDAVGQLPNDGIRGHYAAMKGLLNPAVFEKFIGEPVYLSGPHTGGRRSKNNTEFGYYNPAFLRKLERLIAVMANNPEFVNQIRPFYVRHVRDYLQVYLDAYPRFANNKEMTDVYSEFIQSGQPGASYEPFKNYLERFSGEMIQKGLKANEAYVVPSFRVRRTIDGTADQFYQLFYQVQQVFK
ncbi:MAG: hypothetical protein IPL49_10820 [Saprospirales bacterium]|nr:hypothetical protein [Saprospirales bacterium]